MSFSFGASTTGPQMKFGTQEATIPSSAQKSVSFALPSYSQATAAGGSTSSGFSFGGGATTGTSNASGLSLGAAAPATSGFSLGASKSDAGTFALKLPTATTSAQSTGFSFGTSAATSTSALGAPTTSTGFSLGTGLNATSTGLKLGAPGGLGTATTSTGFSLGAPAPTLGATAAQPVGSTGGFSLGAAAKPATGFSLGSAPLATNTTATGTTGLGLGGALSTPAFPTGTSTLAPATTTVKYGLGGTDPKTSSATTGTASGDGKANGTKSAKEEQVPAEIVKDIENFKTFLKSQKTVREEIARVSSREISGIQEEVNNLRQMLAVVSNGVQRSAVAVDKLRTESAMELKNAEVAQRTKDTPPGLQYENVAPTVYFHRLVEDFEVHMTIYRQQIEEMESYLVALNQPGLFTPQELTMCLKKLHETFLALAAQLHGVHEAVKAQKDQYLNYRKAIHGDTTDVFATRKRTAEKTKSSRSLASIGPTPFAGLTNAAAAAMALSLQRPPQPQPQPQTQQMPGFGSAAKPSMFGTTQPATSNLFGNKQGAFNFGTPKPLANTTSFGNTGTTFGAKPLGFTGFGAGTQQTTTGFGTSLNLGSAPAAGTPSLAFGTTTENKPFQLQSPPMGNKRGKRT